MKIKNARTTALCVAVATMSLSRAFGDPIGLTSLATAQTGYLLDGVTTQGPVQEGPNSADSSSVYGTTPRDPLSPFFYFLAYATATVQFGSSNLSADDIVENSYDYYDPGNPLGYSIETLATTTASASFSDTFTLPPMHPIICATEPGPSGSG